jgi:hypothetical protein
VGDVCFGQAYLNIILFKTLYRILFCRFLQLTIAVLTLGPKLWLIHSFSVETELVYYATNMDG